MFFEGGGDHGDGDHDDCDDSDGDGEEEIDWVFSVGKTFADKAVCREAVDRYCAEKVF